jgi:hypothetical protein
MVFDRHASTHGWGTLSKKAPPARGQGWDVGMPQTSLKIGMSYLDSAFRTMTLSVAQMKDFDERFQ